MLISLQINLKFICSFLTLILNKRFFFFSFFFSSNRMSSTFLLNFSTFQLFNLSFFSIVIFLAFPHFSYFPHFPHFPHFFPFLSSHPISLFTYLISSHLNGIRRPRSDPKGSKFFKFKLLFPVFFLQEFRQRPQALQRCLKETKKERRF